jgi:hypothetical protein
MSNLKALENDNKKKKVINKKWYLDLKKNIKKI